MVTEVYRDLTESLLFFLVIGMFLGLSTGLGLLFIETIDAWSTPEIELSVVVIMVAMSSFFVAPLTSIVSGMYLGWSNSGERTILMFSSFASFVGFFILNIAALSVFLVSTGQPLFQSFADMNDPVIVYYSFLGWENSAAILSIPTLITGLAATYFGKSLKNTE